MEGKGPIKLDAVEAAGSTPAAPTICKVRIKTETRGFSINPDLPFGGGRALFAPCACISGRAVLTYDNSMLRSGYSLDFGALHQKSPRPEALRDRYAMRHGDHSTRP